MTNTTPNPMSKRLPVFIIPKPKTSPAFGPLFVALGDRLVFYSCIAYRHGRFSLVRFTNLGNFYLRNRCTPPGVRTRIANQVRSYMVARLDEA